MKWRVVWFDDSNTRHEKLCHYSTQATKLVASLHGRTKGNIILETLMEDKDKHGDPDAGKARFGGGAGE